MEMKYYNASNNFSAPIPREPKPYTPPQRRMTEVVIPKAPECAVEKAEKKEIVPLKKTKRQALDTDDLLILGLILVLLINSCDDFLLLAILGYLFFAGKKFD